MRQLIQNSIKGEILHHLLYTYLFASNWDIYALSYTENEE